jgi:heterotetrameric sarcosine oxidase gamma subunit
VSEPEPRSVLSGALKSGRFGAPDGEPVRIAERWLSLALVQARRHGAGACREALASALGLSLPEPGKAATAGTTTAIWLQPGCWLVAAPRASGSELIRRLTACCAQNAAIVDQTYGKVVLRLSGKRARDVLAKGCRIDLHPRVFGPGRAASTIIAQIACVVVQIDDSPQFDLIVPSTMAESFFEWLLASAAEYGYEIAPSAA